MICLKSPPGSNWTMWCINCTKIYDLLRQRHSSRFPATPKTSQSPDRTGPDRPGRWHVGTDQVLQCFIFRERIMWLVWEGRDSQTAPFAPVRSERTEFGSGFCTEAGGRSQPARPAWRLHRSTITRLDNDVDRVVIKLLEAGKQPVRPRTSELPKTNRPWSFPGISGKNWNIAQYLSYQPPRLWKDAGGEVPDRISRS